METTTIVIIIIVIVIIIWAIWMWGSPAEPVETFKSVSTYQTVAPYQIDQALMLQQLERANGPNLYNNSYYDLWKAENKATGNLIRKKASDIISSGAACIPFQHVNQCMSECTGSTDCNGFYIDTPSTDEKPGQCCLMFKPKFEHKRTNMLDVPNSRLQDTYQTISDYIRRQKLSEGKAIFDKVGRENGDSVYRSDISRSDCRSLCPKCVLGQCPRGYRCKDIRSDPRKNYNCLITNEDRYDENEGLLFDSDKISFLNNYFANRQDAGIDPSQPEPYDELVFDRESLRNKFPREKLVYNDIDGYSDIDHMYEQQDLWKNSPSSQFLARVGLDRLKGNVPNVNLESYQRYLKRESDPNNNLF